MKLAYYLKDRRLQLDARVLALLADLGASGFDVYPALEASEITPGTEMLLSFGGDGTYLSAAELALQASLPVLGVNFGRLGFLSENRPEVIADALAGKSYSIQRRGLVKVSGLCGGDGPQMALNEICIRRDGGAMLGIDIRVDDHSLPTYWADGLIVATSSGST
ncbi:MAG: NAD(+)/NADH kinase, partial [Bacteroidales bacterium]|nr:NAD(+)/NADH kinase [Bacteroidales bacterium]